MRYPLIFALLTLTAGCATVTRGSSESVAITSNPPEAQATTSLGQTCTTPCSFDVPRKEAFTLKVEKQGYQTAEVLIRTQSSDKGSLGLAGNALAGGLIGMAVDMSNGSNLDHVPNPVHVELTPLPSPSKPQKRSKKSAPPKQEVSTNEHSQ